MGEGLLRAGDRAGEGAERRGEGVEGRAQCSERLWTQSARARRAGGAAQGHL